MSTNALIIAVFQFAILIFSISFHECAHAWTASKLGDQTARMLGRVTLNPMYHVDPIGTILLPALMIFGPLFGFGMFSGMLIGWAKPTPVNTRYFRKIVRDDNLVSMAGPASNLLLCLVAFTVLVVVSVAVPNGHEMALSSFAGDYTISGPTSTVQAIAVLATQAVMVNLSLCVFNLMPIPPLDGSHVVRNMLPYNAVQMYDRISGVGSYILMLLFGRYVVGLLLFPALGVLYTILQLI